MTIDDFLTEFQDLLQRDEPISIDATLEEIEEWDSMSIMACMAWFDVKFGIKLPYTAIAQKKTVQNIIDLTQGQIA